MATQQQNTFYIKISELEHLQFKVDAHEPQNSHIERVPEVFSIESIRLYDCDEESDLWALHEELIRLYGQERAYQLHWSVITYINRLRMFG